MMTLRLWRWNSRLGFGQAEDPARNHRGIPAKDCLLATGSEDAGGIQVIRAMGQKVMAEVPHRLTSTLFVRRGGGFVPFER